MPLIAMSKAAPPSSAEEVSQGYGPYFLCGWKVSSALPLPELAPWAAPESGSAFGNVEAVAIRLVLAAEWVAGHDDAFHYGLEPGGAFLLRLPGLGIYRVSSDATTVTLQPAPGADPQLLRAHFYGSIVAVLCFFHGLLPLHGACVQLGQSAVVFTGNSGAGKSTLAAAFVRQGYSLLCDDVCAIDLSEKHAPRVWPAFPRVKLLPDAIAAFTLDSDTLYTRAVRGEKGHFVLPEDGMKARSALPIQAIYLLQDSSTGDIGFQHLRGASAFLPLKAQVHRANMGTAMGLREDIFRSLSMLLQTVPAYDLNRPRDLQRIDEVVQAVAQHAQAANRV